MLQLTPLDGVWQIGGHEEWLEHSNHAGILGQCNSGSGIQGKAGNHP